MTDTYRLYDSIEEHDVANFGLFGGEDDDESLLNPTSLSRNVLRGLIGVGVLGGGALMLAKKGNIFYNALKPVAGAFQTPFTEKQKAAANELIQPVVKQLSE